MRTVLCNSSFILDSSTLVLSDIRYNFFSQEGTKVRNEIFLKSINSTEKSVNFTQKH